MTLRYRLVRFIRWLPLPWMAQWVLLYYLLPGDVRREVYARALAMIARREYPVQDGLERT